MEQTEEMGICIQLLYADHAIYKPLADKIAHDMLASKTVISKNSKILTNLNMQVEEVDQDYYEYQELCRARESSRIYYDHYRLKLKKLNEVAAEKANKPITSTTYAMSSAQKEQATLVRNQGKFEVSEKEFNQAKDFLEQKSSLMLEKLDKLKINLSVRFFQNVQTNFHQIFNEIYAKMCNIQNEFSALENVKKEAEDIVDLEDNN